MVRSRASKLKIPACIHKLETAPTGWRYNFFICNARNAKTVDSKILSELISIWYGITASKLAIKSSGVHLIGTGTPMKPSSEGWQAMIVKGLSMSRCIGTDRLLLRGLKDPDVDLLIAMLGKPKVMEWLFSGAPMDPDSAWSFIEKEFTFGDDGIGLGSLCEKSPERFIGFAGIIPCQYLSVGDFEFGFALQEDSWGKGYAMEIGKAQIEYGFENLSVDRLFALAHPQNVASLRVIEKIGMRFLKEIPTEQRGPRRVYVIKRG